MDPCKKIDFPTRYEALRVARRWTDNLGRQIATKTYFCRRCAAWHLTTSDR